MYNPSSNLNSNKLNSIPFVQRLYKIFSGTFLIISTTAGQRRPSGDGQVWTRCGYQDKELGTLETIPPASMEIGATRHFFTQQHS